MVLIPVCMPDRLIRAGHNYIGTEHLLLGLLREGEGVAARVLENLGAEPGNIRTQVCNYGHLTQVTCVMS